MNALIEFLINLLGDDDAQAEFAQDPDGTLARAGLDGVTGRDVRDARLLIADGGSVRASGDGGAYSGYASGGDDPVSEIHFTTQNYSATEHAAASSGGFDLDSLDITNNFFSIDDRDTTFTDNSTTDNSTTDVTVIDDSFNTTAATGDITTIDAEDSFNDTDTVTAIQDNDIEDNDVVLIEDNDTDVDVVEPVDPPEAPEPEAAAETETPDTDEADADAVNAAAV
jgi:hypothetical protein